MSYLGQYYGGASVQKLNSLLSTLKYDTQPNARYSALEEIVDFRGAAEHLSQDLEDLIRTESDSNLVALLVEALEKISPNHYGKLGTKLNLNALLQKSITLPLFPKKTSYPYMHNHAAAKAEDTVPGPSLDIEIIPIKKKKLTDDLKVCRKCNFCEHEITISNNKEMFLRLSPPSKFYCTFCLKHNLHTKKAREVMIISFRGILGFLYYELYLFPKTPAMFISEINDLIALHAVIGKANPVFEYNDENCCWFIDFQKVGNSKKKLPVKYVYRTVVEILASLNLTYNVRDIKLTPLFLKYQEAIQKFYESRYRPNGQKICIPTLKGCGTITWSQMTTNPLTGAKFVLEDTKNFLPSFLQGAYPRQKLNPF
jgi:hypothetical protein